MYIVYILKSLKDFGHYIGQTGNIDQRLEFHNKGRVKSTRARRPLVLIKNEAYHSRGEARKRENYLKKLKGGNEFKKIIENRNS